MADETATVVPGQTQGTTPPLLPGSGTPDPAAQVSEMTRRLLATLAQASQRKQFAGTPQPAPVPGQQGMAAARNIGMNTANPHAWGTQRFLAGLGATISNAVAKKKQQDVLKAESDWEYMKSALDELYAAQSSKDPNAIKQAQAKVDVVMGDPKKLKNMAKALNQDWLNPEKTTVYGEALKKVNAKTQQKDQQQQQQAQQKQQAAQGLKGMMQKLLQRQQQPQLSDEQKKQMGAEIQAKAPTTAVGGMSVKDELDAAKTVEELARAQKELRGPGAADKFDVKAIKDADGSEKLVAIDKTDPTKPYIEIKSASGEKAKPGEKKSPNEGKLEIVQGIPTGRVMHGGQYVSPSQSGYSEEDKKAVMLGMGAAGLSQQQKEKLAQVRATSFATERAANTPIAVTDNETGEAGYAPMLDVARNPSKYVQSGEAEKIAARDSVHRSLNANFGALAKDLDKLPNGLDTETQAMISAAMRSDNPGMFETMIVNKVKQNAPDAVLQYITDMKVMQEDILVLRNVGGMGQGSESMRAAITRMIPGTGTSSVKEAKMQMEAAKRTSESLFKGRPQAKFSKDTGEGGDSGGMESKTYNGAVYQRKKGTQDQWTLVPPPK